MMLNFIKDFAYSVKRIKDIAIQPPARRQPLSVFPKTNLLYFKLLKLQQEIFYSTKMVSSLLYRLNKLIKLEKIISWKSL